MGLHMKMRWFLFLCLVLILIGLPRFNRNDWLGIHRLSSSGQGTLGDARYYLDHIRFFRKEGGPELLRPPYAYRPVPMALAAPLPFSPMTSMNLINYAAMLIALWMLIKFLQTIGISPGGCFLGALSFIVSFPSFYYATIGYVDPPLIAVLCAALYLIAKGGQSTALIFLSILSAGINEKYVVIFPVWLLYLLLIEKRNFVKSLLLVGITGCVFLLVIKGIRHFTPTGNYGWYFNVQAIMDNAVRPRTWLSFLLTWGVLGGVLSYYLLKYIHVFFHDKQIFILWVGVVAGLSVWVYGFISVYADGRYVWICYPFMAPLFSIYFERYSPLFNTFKEKLNGLVAK